MPNKFRKSVWVKRGDFVLVTPIQEGGKVKAEIKAVLYKEQVRNNICSFNARIDKSI